MAETTIEWCRRMRADGSMIPGYTFNGHRGCSRVSQGCKFCFAATLSKRNPAVLGTWGPEGIGSRTVAAESYWRQPLKWEKDARQAGERRIVFSADLGDVFEDWQGPMTDNHGMKMWATDGGRWMASSPVGFGGEPRPEKDRQPNPGCRPLTMGDVRNRLFDLIAETPNLDWLLLTKRPENILRMLSDACRIYADRDPESRGYRMVSDWFHGDAPPTVWVGTSVEDQATADERIPHLLRAPAAVRFLSMEPLLGPVDLRRISLGTGDPADHFDCLYQPPGIRWAIVGGESGPEARPMHPDWARSVRDQCQAAGVPYFFKQWGEIAPEDQVPGLFRRPIPGHMVGRIYWPFKAGWDFGPSMARVGKKAAGRMLDGRTWGEFPTAAEGVAR